MSTIEPSASPEYWLGLARAALSRYAEPLLRPVVARLLKPRNQWPAEELIERSLAALTNAAIIDRRLKELSVASRKLLAIIGASWQPVWRVGHLLAILATFDHAEGLTPILALLESGLAYPELPPGITSLKHFEDWLGPSGIASARLFAHPAVTTRSLGEDLGLPSIQSKKIENTAARLNDGLEWLLRAAIAWQRVGAGSVRLTQQQTLFKRDLQRFQTDELLAAPFAEQLTNLPDPGLFALGLAISAGLIESDPLELCSRPAPLLWEVGLLASLIALWRSLFGIETWNPITGYPTAEEASPFPSVALPAFLLMGSIPSEEWCRAEPIARHILERHPSWAASLQNREELATQWIERLFLGIGYPLRFVEIAQDGNGWLFRLSDVGRHVLLAEAAPNLEHDFRQTLIVQPNGEMVIFRQGLTPALIGKLTRFAVWKTLGAACTMELTAESVYHGLETGLSLHEIQRLLEQHGTRTLPANVLDSLQRWANKRDRITIYSSATLLEFSTTADLEAAFARGLVSIKLNERIGLTTAGEEIDYRQLRLTGNRDYEARPQKCIRFEADGVTFTVDVAQSDLILEAELGRLAQALPDAGSGQRRFVLTPASLKRAQDQGVSIAELEQWAVDRSNEPLSSSARLIFPGSGAMAARYERRLVVHLPSEAVADGVLQWPATARLIHERLGPRSAIIAEANLHALIEQLRIIDIEMVPVEGGS